MHPLWVVKVYTMSDTVPAMITGNLQILVEWTKEEPWKGIALKQESITAGEMPHGLGTLSASPGDLGLIPVTKRQLTTAFDSNSKGSATLASVATPKHV